MDFLKKELERKRKAAQEDFGGRKFVRRGELEQKSIDKLRKEEAEERREKAAKEKTGAKGVEAEKQEAAAAKQKATTKSKAGGCARALQRVIMKECGWIGEDRMLLPPPFCAVINYSEKSVPMLEFRVSEEVGPTGVSFPLGKYFSCPRERITYWPSDITNPGCF